MRIIVDRDLCEGHAQCCAAAPEVFALDADYVLQVLVDEVTAEQLAPVGHAVTDCPRQALRLDESADRS